MAKQGIIADFHYNGKKKKLMLNENTTLIDLYHELCSKFVLGDPNNIRLREISIMDTDINKQNFPITKEILLSSVDTMPSFSITTQKTQQIQEYSASPSPSPSPLPPPYTQSVNAPTITSQPFTNLNHHIKNTEITENDMKNDPNQMNIMNAELKIKLTLKHKFRGGNQILPIKPQKLFNFILNNKSFLCDDKSIDNPTLHSIVSNVVKWWFEYGLKRMALCDDSQENKNNLIDTQDNEMKGVTLMLSKLGLNTIKTRNYQQTLFEAAVKGNIICFMPTGSGKTRIAIKVIEYRLKLLYLQRLNNTNEYTKKYLIFLVCTTHLAEQQKNAIKKAIPFVKIRTIIGQNNPDIWHKYDWQNELDYYDVFVMMHDCLKSALSHGYIAMNNIDTLIFDECHHVIGHKKSNQSHPYAVIMEKYHQYKSQIFAIKSEKPQLLLPRIIGLTASPIKTKELLMSKIVKKARELQRMMDAQLMRVDNDELRYVISDPMLVKFYFIALNEEESIQYFNVPPVFITKIRKYSNMINEARLKVVVREMGVYAAAVCMRLIHEKLKNKDSKYLVSNPFSSDDSEKIKEKSQALELFKSYIQQNVGHFDSDLHGGQYSDSKWLFDLDISMKLSLLIKFIADSQCGIQPQIISDEKEEKEEKEGYDSELKALFVGDGGNQQGIIFVKERIVAYVLQSILSTRFAAIKFGVLTGHSCRLWGLTDKEQCKVINRFKNGDLNYLIATSVAEEGIDIQACNCVIMYELPATIKSYIQARGRARRQTSKYVLFINSNCEEQQIRVNSFEQQELEMIKQANTNNEVINEGNIDYNRYEHLVPETQAFASTVNAISMLQRYFDYLGILKTDIEKICLIENDMHTCMVSIDSPKWKLKETQFSNSSSYKKEAEKRCAVDIIAMLRNKGLWDINLVPIEILRKNKETQLLQKQRALFQSVDIKQVNVPSLINQDFSIAKCQLNQDLGDKIAYLYYIVIENDPNSFPMGIILPKRIPDEFLKSIHFSAQIRKRNEEKISKDVRDYSILIHQKLRKLENKKEQKTKPLILDLGRQQMGKSCYMKTTVSLRAATVNNIICVSSDRFNQIMEYHKIAFKLLDRGGTKNKKKLIEIESKEEHEENERFYLICPLKLVDNGSRRMIDWKCIENIVDLQQHYQRNEPHGVAYCNENKSNIEHELIRTRNEDKTHEHLYISYGIHELFSSQSQIPISGQIIADYVSEESRMNGILHSNLELDKKDANNNADPLDEIDLSAQNTKLNKLQTLSIDDNYQKLMLSTKHPGQSRQTKCKNSDNTHDDRVVVARRYSPKIRNILIQSRRKSKNSKSKMKSSVMFIPLQYIFPTGVSTAHWFQLLNIPSIIWRLENYFNIFDAQKLLQSMCDVSIDASLLFEALCNAQAGRAKTYEKLECLGDRVLKFLVVLQGVFTMADANEGDLTIWESNIVANANLDTVSLAINLPSYGVFSSYAFELWNPSYFKPRNNNASESVYKNIKISLKLPADIIESTIGALWYTLNDTQLSDEKVTVAINKCRMLLREYKLFEKDFKIDDKFEKLIRDWNENENKFAFFSKTVFQTNLKQIRDIIDEDCAYKLNLQYPLVTASLIELIDKCYHHHHHSVFADYGITYQRLEFLGDAILDIIVTQFLYNDASFRSDLSIEGQITALRAKIVGNDALGFNLQESSLDEYILWDGQQQTDIDKYKQDIETLRDEIDDNIIDNKDFWYLNAMKQSNIKCPKCLGDAFEVLLAIIFIDSNYNNLFLNHHNVNQMNLDYYLKPCVQFICGFHDYAEKHWQHLN